MKSRKSIVKRLDTVFSLYIRLRYSDNEIVDYYIALDPTQIKSAIGNSGEFEYAYNLFNQMVIQPAQLVLENTFNEILAINQMTVNLKFNDAEITTPTMENSQVVINNNT